jgi:hypothetical protein
VIGLFDAAANRQLGVTGERELRDIVLTRADIGMPLRRAGGGLAARILQSISNWSSLVRRCKEWPTERHAIMDALKLIMGRQRTTPGLRNASLYLVVALLPGSIVILPLLWWVLRRIRQGNGISLRSWDPYRRMVALAKAVARVTKTIQSGMPPPVKRNNPPVITLAPLGTARVHEDDAASPIGHAARGGARAGAQCERSSVSIGVQKAPTDRIGTVEVRPLWSM